MHCLANSSDGADDLLHSYGCEDNLSATLLRWAPLREEKFRNISLDVHPRRYKVLCVRQRIFPHPSSCSYDAISFSSNSNYHQSYHPTPALYNSHRFIHHSSWVSSNSFAELWDASGLGTITTISAMPARRPKLESTIRSRAVIRTTPEEAKHRKSRPKCQPRPWSRRAAFRSASLCISPKRYFRATTASMKLTCSPKSPSPLGRDDAPSLPQPLLRSSSHCQST